MIRKQIKKTSTFSLVPLFPFSCCQKKWFSLMWHVCVGCREDEDPEKALQCTIRELIYQASSENASDGLREAVRCSKHLTLRLYDTLFFGLLALFNLLCNRWLYQKWIGILNWYILICDCSGSSGSSRGPQRRIMNRVEGIQHCW